MNIYGAPYPIQKNPRGFFNSQSGLNQVKSDLLVLLLTNPGERVMLPEFGTPLRTLIFDPNDTTIAQQAQVMIEQSIATWEPRITVSAINVGLAPDGPAFDGSDIANPQHVLSIQIKFFSPEQINEVQQLTLEVPLAGG